MRLFIAVELPPEIRSALGDLQRDLKSSAGNARWVAPDSIHVTLKFLGEVVEEQIKDIDHALAGLSWKPFTLTVRGLGFFPGARSPRVLWAGLEAPTLAALAEQIDIRMERAGFDREKRAFRPHVTLARARDARIDSLLVQGAGKYQDVEFGSFVVDRFFLYKSTLRASGAVHEKRKEYPA
jgi:RNA 2',3'-cyclic 3'-phosphodiesterase